MGPSTGRPRLPAVAETVADAVARAHHDDGRFEDEQWRVTLAAAVRALSTYDSDRSIAVSALPRTFAGPNREP
jgi:hypothetical protein